jgi:hypothetical protein
MLLVEEVGELEITDTLSVEYVKEMEDVVLVDDLVLEGSLLAEYE